MECPGEELIHDLVSDELEDARRPELIAHVHACPACMRQVRELLLIESAMELDAELSPCPSPATLTAFTAGRLSPIESDRVQAHVDTCEQCLSYLDPEPSQAQTQAARPDEVAGTFAGAGLTDVGQAAAGEILDAVLPGRRKLLDLLWARVSHLLQELRGRPLDQWPSLAAAGPAAGALGFSGVPDPETLSTALVLATTLALTDQIAEGTLAPEPVAIQASARQVASQLGAGKELTSRLSEILPVVLLR